MTMKQSKYWVDRIWDLWCACSILGIWPRFIEPRLLCISHLTIRIPHLPAEMQGLKILHLTDLHWHRHFSHTFFSRLIKKIHQLKPDIIVFTGDFLCRSQLEEPHILLSFLSKLKAPFGCFAVLGNHDYSRFVTVNATGDYDVEPKTTQSTIGKGFRRLWRKVKLSKQRTAAVSHVQEHASLIKLLQQTPFRLLNNETCQVPIGKSLLNICGLGEYTLGRLHVEHAFRHYDSHYPGVVLVHNPDAVPHLEGYPGQLILAGHTHGGQINLPGIWQRFTCLENPRFKRGLLKEKGKWIYVNRGIGSVMKFRWFSPPEIALITLNKESPQ